MDLPTLRDRVRAVRAEVLPVQPADVAYMRADQPDHAASEPRCSVMANVSDFAIVSGDVELQRFATGAGGQAVNDQPFTVADLRRWAQEHRDLADTHGNMQHTEWNLKVAAEALAQAAAFTALADGIELCNAPSDPDMQIGKNPSPGSKAWLQGSDHAYEEIGRILRGEKP